MSELKNIALEYIKAGISTIPTGENKVPFISWTPYQSRTMTDNEVEKYFEDKRLKGVAIVCGKVSGSLEVIDVDTKYDLTGKLWERFSKAIKDSLPDVYRSLVIAQTKSGGFHLYYLCDTIEGNTKLANRATTKEEREQLYQSEYEKKIKDNASKEEAEKHAIRQRGNDKVRVLIETRGEGGYVMAPPTPGYTYLQGSPHNIARIKPEDRLVLWNIAKGFNELQEVKREPVINQPTTSNYSEGFSPFKDFNERGDLVGWLQSEKGYTYVRTEPDHKDGGERIQLLRPGSATSETSVNFHTKFRKLYVHSSSIELHAGESYSPSDVFIEMECNGDKRLAARRLLDMGYGTPGRRGPAQPKQIQTERIKVEIVNKVNSETSVISNPGEMLNMDTIRTAEGERVIITSPGPEASNEVLSAIEGLAGAGKKIYIKEGDESPVREYRYFIGALFNKYWEIQEATGELTDMDRDNLQEEAILFASMLSQIDSDIFQKELIDQEAFKELGITKESLKDSVERVRTKRAKNTKEAEAKRLLSEAMKLHEAGDIDKALDLLTEKVKDVRLLDKAVEFSRMLIPPTRHDLKAEWRSVPDSLDTGFKIGGHDILLPTSAVLAFAAATGAGKTAMLINTAMEVADRYPDKRFIFYTYEEPAFKITNYFLNVYVDMNLNRATDSNRRLLETYHKNDSLQYIGEGNRAEFLKREDEFYTKYIESGRILINYVNYKSKDLISAIEWAKKETNNLGAVFIDYFQLLELDEKAYKSRQEELKQICIALKDVSVSTGLPLVLAAQFNREVTNLLRMHATNIGEAGDIERVLHTLIGVQDINWESEIHAMKETEAENIKKIIGNRTSGMYAKILKSRDLPRGAYTIFQYNGNTGRIRNGSNFN